MAVMGINMLCNLVILPCTKHLCQQLGYEGVLNMLCLLEFSLLISSLNDIYKLTLF